MRKDPAEALRRIEEARRTQADTLDLGDLALAELPAELRDLTHLRRLYLGRVKPSSEGADTFDFGRELAPFTDLTPLAGLASLQSLDLRGTGVTDLSPLAGLPGLRSLDLRDTGVADLSQLAGLGGLQSLDFGGTGVTDLSPLARLAGLQSLYFDGTDVADLSPLAGLAGLQCLDLSCTGVADLSPLAGLAGLQGLDLSSTGVADLSPLAGLRGLQSLHLASTGVADLSPLAGLAGLQSLDLSSTGVADLSPLARLAGLQSLYLWQTGGVTDLSPLAGLPALQTLNLDSASVTDLSPLAGLPALQTLSLEGTGVTDLWPLSGLPTLQSLDLNSTSVTDLSPLSGLAGLQRLVFSSTGVTDLSPLSGLAGLQSLVFSSTGVTDLSPLSGLAGLQSLVFSNTGVKDLSPLFGLRTLRDLRLLDNHAPLPTAMLRIVVDLAGMENLVANFAMGVPREVLSSHGFDNCLPRLRAYFRELDLGAEAENEMKVVLLGNGRAGKTQLCRRLRGEGYDESVASTHGVQIWRQRQRIPTADGEQEVQVNWWDFGGQDIYHGTHSLFLRSRAVFLVLWAPHLENHEAKEEDGTPWRNQPLAYWLDYVRSLAGKESPVIIVQSQCDAFADRRSDPPRPAGMGFFECCAYSAKTGRGREALEGHLHDALRCLLEQSGPLSVGRGRAAVRRRLYEWRTADQKRLPGERRHRTLTIDELRALCEDAGGIVSWGHALDYLHQTGVVFYDPDLFENRIVLDQDWALDAIYTVFHRGSVVPFLRDSGRFTREDLAPIAWPHHSAEEQRLFLGLMESCGVCFRCGKTARGEPRYVAPDLLPGFEVVSGRLHGWQEGPGSPTLRMEYGFFHPAVIRGLMQHVGREAGDLAEYWRYGLWLKDARTASQLLVEFEDTATDDAPGAGALVLQAQGRDPLRLLRSMREVALRQRIGERPKEELLSLEGVTVSRGALVSAVEGRVAAADGRMVAAAPFAAFFAEDAREAFGHGHTGEPTEPAPRGAALMPNLEPQRLTAAEKPPEVFLSYAWGDASPAGKLRAQAVDRLQAALAADGFAPVRDRDQIRSGERISAFIRRLTRADLVVAVISDRYLRSTFCMYEIYRIWQRCQEEPDDLTGRLVPLVLPDVKLGGFAERAPYQRFWSRRVAELEALFRDPELKPGRADFEELLLARDFAAHLSDILAFVQDIHVPRDLARLYGTHFEALRQALWRLATP